MCSDRVVVSYHDSLLRQSDVQLLRPPGWLNDTLIGFYFEYVQREVLAARPRAQHVLFVSPEVVQLLRLCAAAELAQMVGQLQLADQQLVLLPVSDCDSRLASGGSHWSLLVFRRHCSGDQTAPSSGQFLHYDSQPVDTANAAAARALSRRLTPLLLPNTPDVRLPVCRASGGYQQNGYDCGVFVLCHALAVAERFCCGDSVDSVDVDQRDADNKRRELGLIIDRLASRS